MIRLRIPGSLRYRDLTIRVVAAACKLVRSRGHELERDFDNMVVSAFGEAFNNVALHSYRGKTGDVEVEIECFDDRITLRLLDFGATYNPTAVPTPNLDELPESGLGVFIMRSFMDDVSYQSGTPNILSMTKYADPSRRPAEVEADGANEKDVTVVE